MKIFEMRKTYKFRVRVYGPTTTVLLNWLNLACQGIEHEDDVITWKDGIDEFFGLPRKIKYTERVSKVLTKRLTETEFKYFIKEFKGMPGLKLKKHKTTDLILLDIDLTKA